MRTSLKAASSGRLNHLPKNVADIYVWYLRSILDGVDGAITSARNLKPELSAKDLETVASRLGQGNRQAS